MGIAEDEKSAQNYPDNKSMFSQYDVMSQYTNYIDQKNQNEDERNFNDFKTKQTERKRNREIRNEAISS